MPLGLILEKYIAYPIAFRLLKFIVIKNDLNFVKLELNTPKLLQKSGEQHPSASHPEG